MGQEEKQQHHTELVFSHKVTEVSGGGGGDEGEQSTGDTKAAMLVATQRTATHSKQLTILMSGMSHLRFVLKIIWPMCSLWGKTSNSERTARCRFGFHHPCLRDLKAETVGRRRHSA